MRYGQIRKYDVANGPGVRTSIFVTGCYHKCFNCFNPEYQDFQCGDLWTDDETNLLIEYLKTPHIKGLSLLGGEPMEHADKLVEIIKQVKKEVNKDIWVWSGYLYEDLIKDDSKRKLLEEVDFLVDGKFVEKLKDLNLKFRGSSNQRIIDLRKTEASKEIVLYEE